MEEGQARLFFGNIELTNGWDFTFQDGVQPCACLLRSPAHWSLPPQLMADLIIEQDGRTRTFINCHIADPVFEAGMDGQEVTLPILDRRWMWAGTTISGSYNVRQADETLLREKTPQELASLLLDALGEGTRDVGNLPNDARPHVTWEDASARDELDRLCNDLGCIVTIEQDGFKATYLAKIGEGPNLPPGPALGGEYSIRAKPLPSAVEVIADRTIYEMTFELAPVGMETDMKTYKHPNLLSFKPATGWATRWPDDPLAGVLTTYVDPFDGETKDHSDLAAGYVYRAHQITGINTAGNWTPPGIVDGDLTPEKFKDLLILSSRAGEVVIGEGDESQKEPLPPIVSGTWHDWNKSTRIDKVWPWGFAIDIKHGVVILSQPAFRYDPTNSDGPYSFADLKLRTAFHAGKGGVFNHHRFRLTVPGADAGAPVAPFFRREIRRRIIGKSGGITSDNFTDVDNECANYAIDLVANLSPTDSTAVQYEEIRDDIELSGKVRQITYSGGGGRPGTTKVSTGTPHNPYVETSDTQRLPRELRDALRGVVRLGAVDYTLSSRKRPWEGA